MFFFSFLNSSSRHSSLFMYFCFRSTWSHRYHWLTARTLKYSFLLIVTFLKPMQSPYIETYPNLTVTTLNWILSMPLWDRGEPRAVWDQREWRTATVCLSRQWSAKDEAWRVYTVPQPIVLRWQLTMEDVAERSSQIVYVLLRFALCILLQSFRHSIIWIVHLTLMISQWTVRYVCLIFRNYSVVLAKLLYFVLIFLWNLMDVKYLF